MAASAPLNGFPPLLGASPRLLVLGTLPGAASLAAGEYYAHPRNAFWPIMGALFGAHPALPYAERTRCLTEAGVALWDVLARAVRPGSLDAAIDPASAVANPIAELLATHPGIGVVVFNGGAAERLFHRHVLPTLTRTPALRRAPSTSPAYAGMRAGEKLAAWTHCVQAT